MHILDQTKHSAECDEVKGQLVCANDCTTRRFLDWLEEPLMPWEIEEDERIRQRRKDLMRGII